VLGVETLRSVVEQTPNELRFDLHPGLAEGGSRDGPFGGQRQVEGSAFVPEGVEEGLVSPPAGVGDEVEEKGDEEFGREWALSREVLFSGPERVGIAAGDQLGD